MLEQSKENFKKNNSFWEKNMEKILLLNYFLWSNCLLVIWEAAFASPMKARSAVSKAYVAEK